MRLITSVTLPEQASPSTPASGGLSVYAKTDGQLYYKNDGGTEVGPLTAVPTNLVTLDTVQTLTAAKTIRTATVPVFAMDGGASATGTIAVSMGRASGAIDAWFGAVGTTKFFNNDVAGDFSIRANTATAAINLGYGVNSTGNAALKISSSGVVAGVNLYEGANRVYSSGNLVPIAGISATGTPSSSNYLRGDGTWATITAGDATLAGTQTFTGSKSFQVTATDFGAGAASGTGGYLRIGNSTNDASITALSSATDANITYTAKGLGTHIFNQKINAQSNTIQTTGTVTGGTVQATGASGVLDNGNRVYSGSNLVPIAGISATGTPSSTTYLRGDGSWASVSSGGSPTGVAGGSLAGTYPNPTLGTSVVSDAQVSATAAIAETKLALASDGPVGTPTRRTLGTGATQAMPGNAAALNQFLVSMRLPVVAINGAASGSTFITGTTFTFTAPSSGAVSVSFVGTVYSPTAGAAPDKNTTITLSSSAVTLTGVTDSGGNTVFFQQQTGALNKMMRASSGSMLVDGLTPGTSYTWSFWFAQEAGQSAAAQAFVSSLTSGGLGYIFVQAVN